MLADQLRDLSATRVASAQSASRYSFADLDPQDGAHADQSYNVQEARAQGQTGTDDKPGTGELAPPAQPHATRGRSTHWNATLTTWSPAAVSSSSSTSRASL